MIRLSDAFIPSVYGSYTAVDNPETSAFVRAGIITTNAFLGQIAKGGGKTLIVPFWKDIDPTIEPNYSNDDPSDLAVPYGITSGTMTARKAWLNQWFGEMDLVQELAGESPLRHVKNRFGTYWTRQLQRRVIAMCVGLLADNVANDAGDMLVDISGLTGNSAIFGSDAFIDAAYTMGDQAENIRAIAVHSSIMARMIKNDDIVDIKDSEGRTILQTYKGRAVVVDDALPVSGSGANRVYTSILYGSGSFGFGGVDGHEFAMGEGVPKVAAEVDRTALAGNGGGMESIGERKTWMIHPLGFEWIEPTAGTVGGALVEFSPQLSDLRRAVVWNRVVDRKNIPMAFIKSKA